MGWFTKTTEPREQAALPDLWHVCPACQAHVFKDEWEAALKVCPKCGHHDRLSARERIGLLVDPGSFREFGAEILPSDPLAFSDAKGPYAAKAAAVKKLGTSESVVVGSGNVEGVRIVLAVMDFRFLGGSLSTGCGEKIALAIQHAIDFNRAFVMVSAPGGARMHEGILSLMQMAKTCAALQRLEVREERAGGDAVHEPRRDAPAPQRARHRLEPDDEEQEDKRQADHESDHARARERRSEEADGRRRARQKQ